MRESFLKIFVFPFLGIFSFFSVSCDFESPSEFEMPTWYVDIQLPLLQERYDLEGMVDSVQIFPSSDSMGMQLVFEDSLPTTSIDSDWLEVAVNQSIEFETVPVMNPELSIDVTIDTSITIPLGVALIDTTTPIPGGMLSNLESQLKSINQEDKLEKVKEEIPVVREDFGFPPLVTPVSQIIGAQSLLNVTENSRYGSLTSETKKLLLGAYGKLPGKINGEILKKASDDPPEKENEKNTSELKGEFKDLCQKNDLPDLSSTAENLLTYILFPNIAFNFFKERSF